MCQNNTKIEKNNFSINYLESRVYINAIIIHFTVYLLDKRKITSITNICHLIQCGLSLLLLLSTGVY